MLHLFYGLSEWIIWLTISFWRKTNIVFSLIRKTNTSSAPVLDPDLHGCESFWVSRIRIRICTHYDTDVIKKPSAMSQQKMFNKLKSIKSCVWRKLAECYPVLRIRADFFRIRIRGSGFKISDPYGHPFFILK